MKLACNIDSRGKRVRLINGILSFTAGLVGMGLSLGFDVGGGVLFAASIALLAAGAFMIFEARAGWCVVRAMGFKTSI